MEYRIKQLCKQKGITLVELASKAGVPQSSLSRIITGKVSPTVESLDRIASSLNVPIQELFSASDSNLYGVVVYLGTPYRIDSMEALKQLVGLIESKTV